MIQILLVTLPLAVIFLDRVTKMWATQYACQSPLSIVGEYISCMVTYNRGVSWSLLSYKSMIGFSAVTLLIMGVIGLLVMHMVTEYRKNNMLFGEILVLGGALSNLYDRLVYGGVLDFIRLQYGSWVFPVFNVADIAIVGGVLIMLYDATIRR